MKRSMTALSALGMLAGGTAAQAQASDPYCTDLRRIVSAARERPPFATLLRDDAPAFLMIEGCQKFEARAAAPLVCSWRAPVDEVRDEVAQRTLACLPGAVREDGGALLVGSERRIVYRRMTLAIGQMVLAGGRISRDVYLHVYPRGRPHR